MISASSFSGLCGLVYVYTHEGRGKVAVYDTATRPASGCWEHKSSFHDSIPQRHGRVVLVGGHHEEIEGLGWQSPSRYGATSTPAIRAGVLVLRQSYSSSHVSV